MHRLLILLVFLLALCAADNQTLLVTRGDAGISINDTGGPGDSSDLPPEFYTQDLLRIGVQLYTVDSNDTVEELCALLKDFQPDITSCEGDVAISLDQVNATDDPLITQQANLDVIRATDAWAKGYTGDPAVRVCVIDSGLISLPFVASLLFCCCPSHCVLETRVYRYPPPLSQPLLRLPIGPEIVPSVNAV